VGKTPENIIEISLEISIGFLCLQYNRRILVPEILHHLLIGPQGWHPVFNLVASVE
jgi:hypothetical protein